MNCIREGCATPLDEEPRVHEDIESILSQTFCEKPTSIQTHIHRFADSVRGNTLGMELETGDESKLLIA